MSDNINTIRVEDIEALTPRKSYIWAAIKQPLFKTFNEYYGNQIETYFGNSFKHGHLLKGISPTLYKPKKLLYIGMYYTSESKDRLAILCNPDDQNLTSSYVLNCETTGQFIVASVDKPPILGNDFLASIANFQTNRIIKLNKVALDEKKCFELCRYYNVVRSNQYLDKGLDLTACGHIYEDILTSMLSQLEEARNAEYMVDPAKRIKEDLESGLQRVEINGLCDEDDESEDDY